MTDNWLGKAYSVYRCRVFSPRPGNSFGRAGVLPTRLSVLSPRSEARLIDCVNRNAGCESIYQLHINRIAKHHHDMAARTGLFLAFALIIILFGMAIVEQMMSAAAAVFEVVPHQ